MLYTFVAIVIAMTASLENIIETDEVRLNIRIGVRDRIAYAGLCGKVDYDVEVVLGKEANDEGLVSNVATNEGEVAVQFVYLGETKLFEGRSRSYYRYR